MTLAVSRIVTLFSYCLTNPRQLFHSLYSKLLYVKILSGKDWDVQATVYAPTLLFNLASIFLTRSTPETFFTFLFHYVVLPLRIIKVTTLLVFVCMFVTWLTATGKTIISCPLEASFVYLFFPEKKICTTACLQQCWRKVIILLKWMMMLLSWHVETPTAWTSKCGIVSPYCFRSAEKVKFFFLRHCYRYTYLSFVLHETSKHCIHPLYQTKCTLKCNIRLKFVCKQVGTS